VSVYVGRGGLGDVSIQRGPAPDTPSARKKLLRFMPYFYRFVLSKLKPFPVDLSRRRAPNPIGLCEISLALENRPNPVNSVSFPNPAPTQNPHL